MPLTLKAGNVSTKYYTVAGDTLEAVWKDVQKKGPKDGSTKVAAITETEIIVSKLMREGMATPSKKKQGEFDAVIAFKSGLVTYTGEILLPKLSSDKNLSKEARAEWKRFMGKLLAHEKAHVAKTRDLALKILKEIEALKITTTAPDKKKAGELAMKALKSAFEKGFTKKIVSARIENMHAAYDKATGHGSKTGAKLNYGIK